MLNDKIYERCPEHCRGTIKRYFKNKLEPEGYIKAVLCNDLMAAFIRADSISLLEMPDLIQWLYTYAPADYYGSIEKVKFWLNN